MFFTNAQFSKAIHYQQDIGLSLLDKPMSGLRTDSTDVLVRVRIDTVHGCGQASVERL